jgi:four helix bundle protein
MRFRCFCQEIFLPTGFTAAAELLTRLGAICPIRKVGAATGWASESGSESESKARAWELAVPLNIAEGNGKATDRDRRRYFEIARGSALECGAIQGVLQVCGALGAEENATGKTTLDPMVAMLTKLGQHGYAIHEESGDYAVSKNDTDADSGTDSECSRK